MKPQGLGSGLTCSIFLHLLLALSVFFVIRFTQTQKLPVPYIVSLVDMPAPGGGKTHEPPPVPVKKEMEAPSPPQPAPKPAEKPKTAPEPKAAPEPKQVLPSEKAPKKPQPAWDVSKERESGRIEDRIAAIEAKKRIERLVALRKMVDIGGQTAGRGKPGKGSAAGEEQDYYSQVMEEVRSKWIFPESLGRDLEAIVAVRVAADGKVTIIGMEKSSGNTLFDRSVIRAITLASPLPPPPPGAMEMGLRFRP